MRSPLIIAKYLSRYAEPQAENLAAQLPQQTVPFKHVVVVPAKDESPAFLTRLFGLLTQTGHSLGIVIINQSEATVTNLNQALFAHALERGEALNPQTVLVPLANDSGCLIVDQFTQALNPKHGVGLARKIGGDIALHLLQRKCLQSDWLHCSDADVFWPSDYLTAAAGLSASALIYPFKHQRNQHGNAIKLYELRQHYYAQGLRWAGSPYGFTTVGSTLAISAVHYAKVRGFPKLAAGEDFHMLNKLAKTGNIISLASPVLAIEDRISERVPFGTGQTLKRLQAAPKLGDEALFEPTSAFTLLKVVIAALDDCWQLGNAAASLRLLTQKTDAPTTVATFFTKPLNHAFKQSADLAQFTRQFHTAFDALQTLRCIHHLSDHHLDSAQKMLAQSPPWITLEQHTELTKIIQI